MQINKFQGFSNFLATQQRLFGTSTIYGNKFQNQVYKDVKGNMLSQYNKQQKRQQSGGDLRVYERTSMESLLQQKQDVPQDALVEIDDFKDLTVAEFIQFIMEKSAEMVYSNDIELAIQVLLKSGRSLNSFLPPESPVRGSLMHQLAYLYNAQGRYQEAEDLINSCLDLAELNFSKVGFTYFDTQVTAGTNLILQGRIQEAVPHIRNAMINIAQVQVFRNGNLPDAHFQAALVQLGYCETAEDVEQVIPTLEYSIQQMQTDLMYYKPPSPDLNVQLMLRCYQRVFTDIQRNKQYKQEIPTSIQRNLEYLFREYMPDCQEHVDFLHSWGMHLYLKNNYQEAYNYVDRAFSLAKKMYGDNDIKVMSIYQRQGMINALTDNYEYAEVALTLSLEYFQAVRGEQSSIVNESILGQAIYKNRQRIGPLWSFRGHWTKCWCAPAKNPSYQQS